MSKKRRQFSREFKLQVIREIESGVPAAQISRQHQINESLLHKWKKQYRQNPQDAFSGPGRASTEEAKIADLERTIGKLYLENAFLKKTRLFRVKWGNRAFYRKAAITLRRKLPKLRKPKALRLMSLILLLIPSTMPLVVR